MAEGNAAPAAGEGSSDDFMALVLEEVGGKPVAAEEEQKPASEEIIDKEDETEEPAEKSEDSEDVEEEAEESDEEKSEDEDEEADKDEAPTQDKIQRRIDKLTAQKKEALEKAQSLETEAAQAKQRLAELEAQLNETSRPVLSPSAENPLADIYTEEALQEKIKSAQQVRRWALDNSDGAEVKKPDGTSVYVDSDQVKQYLLKADDVLTIWAPERKQWLSQREPALQITKEHFPDILKKGTPMNEAFHATVKQRPEMLKYPDAEYVVALALYGEQQFMAKLKADQAKAKAAKKVSSAKSESKTPTPASPVSTAKTSTKGTVRKDVRDRVMSGAAGLDDLEAFVSDRLFG